MHTYSILKAMYACVLLLPFLNLCRKKMVPQPGFKPNTSALEDGDDTVGMILLSPMELAALILH